ncbi:hypothetical protein [Nitrosopumilus sp.]|uniref:hypothetical protein n=1 Tax=Nitrosopumilus sp. TaxID=2024843 RepID=UPI00247E4FF9|nr:hypothetical protein [Nitrosopumilus sp.]MCV0430722.1 hypothetical protein [Nitrosopumilus sp.]
MNQNIFEKEAYLKDLVEKLLRNRNLSDFDTLNNLFEEIKKELKNQTQSTN